MAGLSPYWILFIQILLVVHVLKTGRNRYWILILLFLPLLGGLAYLAVEILPELASGIRGQRARRTLAGVVNPGGQLRDLARSWERTPNADNARHYAAALLDAGRYDEAAKVLEQALSGLFATEPNLLLISARLAFERGEPGRAVATLDDLQSANPDFRSPEGHLLLAQALEADGQEQRALDEYRSVSTYFPGAEARYRYAMALESFGKADESREELRAILADARLAPAHFRKAQSHWLSLSRAALKSLGA